MSYHKSALLYSLQSSMSHASKQLNLRKRSWESLVYSHNRQKLYVS